MKKVLVSGSIAYDYIMKFEGFFKDAILQKNLRNLNISFTGVEKKMFFGGCGANICYNFSQFGSKNSQSILYGVVGKDFKEYETKLSKDGINTSFVGVDESGFTASAYILTDNRENQIAIFSPGPSGKHKSEEKLNFKDFNYAILSPDICDRTVRLAKKLRASKVPLFFDPGQMTHVFKLEDLKYLTSNSYGLIANSYEIKLLCKRLKISEKNLREKFKITIETLGEKGLKVFKNDGKSFYINSVKPTNVIDPTGCGDAFRGGFLAGLVNDLDHEESCKIGALCATYKIEKPGTQNHKFTLAQFRTRYKKVFKENCSI